MNHQFIWIQPGPAARSGMPSRSTYPGPTQESRNPDTGRTCTGERTQKLLEAIDTVARARRARVPTAELNRFVARVAAEHPPASPGRRHVRILYAAQTGVAPPTFVFFTNVATTFHFSYVRFLENRLREAFGFAGTPIRIHVRARKRDQT